ncbi:hypothetical protein SARC_01142 [Sphaeroforma arctica JP610]|uniref:Uncharacterized protein n=1 Tax=Sphaeroforma arctica JP610 TaxID=667725 RepID=A0A0L0GCI6_9EUKA|nr:hypothetical protein SARC_01142 [Sphaeroforma arctica JP610]KNC86722.1 hypothetical protein SARC_01142 [Sphaeroforma arctica JP610]|eukprot:XP_014160624.1 hypothetical protein SARC_01142 [Sphaeroforma arctica JP610]
MPTQRKLSRNSSATVNQEEAITSQSVPFSQGQANVDLRKAICHTEAREYTRLINIVDLISTSINSTSQNAQKTSSDLDALVQTMDAIKDQLSFCLDHDFLPHIKQ